MNQQIELINYTETEEKVNTVTHAFGLVLAISALILLMIKAVPTHEANQIAAAIIYPLCMMIMYSASALYHGLSIGKVKQIARIIDHSMVSIMIAGTAAPCALITLYNVDKFWCCFVLLTSVLSAAICVSTAFLCFNKTRTLRMILYLFSGAVMLSSVIPTWDSLNKQGVFLLITGCIFYIVGLIFLKKGQTIRYMHAIFHLFTLLGTVFHFVSIYIFVF